MRASLALLAGVTFAAQAFTLGDLRGAAVIGRVLDVSVRVQGGAGEEVSASCVGADLYFSDARQTAPLVTVSTGPDGLAAVRIQSTVIVNEPVVTVQVRATCGSNTTRRYVMLADFPQLAPTMVDMPVGVSDAASKAASPGAEVVPVLVLPTPAESVPVASAAGKTVRPAKSVGESKEARPPRVAKAKKASTNLGESTDPVAHKAADKPVRTAGKSVLKLDPLDILSDRIDSLDSVMLFAPTEDAIKHTQQITSLQSDVKTLRDLAAKNDAKLADMRTQLQQAQEQQLPMLLVYALLALVLLCLGAVAWLWQKQLKNQKNAHSAWWQDGENAGPSTILMPQAAPPAAPVPAVKPVFAVQPGVAPKPAPVVAPAPISEKPPTDVAAVPAPVAHDVDLDIDLDNFMLTDAKPVTAPTLPAGTVPPAYRIHQISVEPILDIRQQAEFFVSLGQTDRALRILKKQIAEANEPNPMVYMDLLALYHSLGLKADFREQREAFGQQFNALVPDFPSFNLEGKDLEAYPEVLADLTKRWPGAQALVFLDACIFYSPQAQIRPLFDLAAFRDLLLLHMLAEDMTPDMAVQGAGSMVPVTHPARVPEPMPGVTEPMLEALKLTVPPPLAHAPVAKATTLTTEPVSNLTLVPAPDVPTPKEATPAATISLAAAPIEKLVHPIDALPSRMLDLDFSSLALPAAESSNVADDNEPIIKPPVRYATRTRWPVTKKPK